MNGLLAIDDSIIPAYQPGEEVALSADAVGALSVTDYTVVGHISGQFLANICPEILYGIPCILVWEEDLVSERYTDIWVSAPLIQRHTGTTRWNVNEINQIEDIVKACQMDEMLDEADVLLDRAETVYPERLDEIVELKRELSIRQEEHYDVMTRQMRCTNVTVIKEEILHAMNTARASGNIEAFDSFDEMAEWIRTISLPEWDYTVQERIYTGNRIYAGLNRVSWLFTVIFSAAVLLICLMFLRKTQKYIPILFSGAAALCAALVMVSAALPYGADKSAEQQPWTGYANTVILTDPDKIDQVMTAAQSIYSPYEMRRVQDTTEFVTDPDDLSIEVGCTVYWFEEQGFSGFLLLNAESEGWLDLTANSVVISQKLASLYRIGPGDSLQLRDSTLIVTGVAKNYDGIRAWISSALYENVYGRKWDPDMIWLTVYEDAQDLESLTIPGVRSVFCPDPSSSQLDTLLELCRHIAPVFLTASFVLMLFLFFAAARKNFHPVAIFFGAVLGLIVGIPLKDAFLTTIETVDVFFVRDTPVWLIFLALLPAAVCGLACLLRQHLVCDK